MTRECECCHRYEAILYFRKQWVCRRCLYPDQEQGYGYSSLAVLSKDRDYHPDSYMPPEVGNLQPLKRPLDDAIEKHQIKNEYTLHSLILQPS